MNWYQTLLFYTTAGVQIALLVLGLMRGLLKRLPWFVGYTCLLCMSSVALLIVYGHYGFQSAASYYGYWIVVATLMVAQGFAIADLCRYELRAYRGVWALAWRILAFVAVLTLLNAVIDAKGNANWIPPFATAISRDIAIASITVLGALLLIRGYYNIQMESFETKLAGGMFFFCLVDVVNQTVMQKVFLENAGRWARVKPQILPFYHQWGTIQAVAFIVALCIWCLALVKPLPAPASVPELLPEDVYAELSPAINIQLRSYSERLLEMLKT